MDTSNDTTQSKTCSKCGNNFPVTTEYFAPRSDSEDGLRGTCRACRLTVDREYRERNEKRLKEQARNYYLKHEERLKDLAKEYYLANRAHILENVARYQSDHPDEVVSHKRRYYEKNKDAAKLRAKAWNRKHPETIRRLARINNPKRRARKKIIGGTFTQSDIDLQLRSQHDKCWHCSKPVGDTYHVDHLIPLSRGGSNAPENIVISCPSCNLSKGAKLTSEWNGRLF